LIAFATVCETALNEDTGAEDEAVSSSSELGTPCSPAPSPDDELAVLASDIGSFSDSTGVVDEISDIVVVAAMSRFELPSEVSLVELAVDVATGVSAVELAVLDVATKSPFDALIDSLRSVSASPTYAALNQLNWP
jgi:hypothetical protein